MKDEDAERDYVLSWDGGFDQAQENRLYQAGATLITHTNWGSRVGTNDTNPWDRDYSYHGTLQKLQSFVGKVQVGQYNSLFVKGKNLLAWELVHEG